MKAIYSVTVGKWEGNLLTVIGEGRLLLHTGAELLPDSFITKPHETVIVSFSRAHPIEETTDAPRP